MTKELLNSILLEQSAKLGLPINLLLAIVQVESGGNANAYRVEPAYRYLVNCATGKPFRDQTKAEIASERAPLDFTYIPAISSRDTEWWGQQASWGAIQVMGAVAREYGFRGAFPELCSAAGIEYACKHLAKLRDRFFKLNGWAGVAAAYNAGSIRRDDEGLFVNQDYVDKIAKAGGLKAAV